MKHVYASRTYFASDCKITENIRKNYKNMQLLVSKMLHPSNFALYMLISCDINTFVVRHKYFWMNIRLVKKKNSQFKIFLDKYHFQRINCA